MDNERQLLMAEKTTKPLLPGTLMLISLAMVADSLLLLATPCSAADFDTSGMVSGKVTESKDRVVIEGATFVVGRDGKLPAVRLDKDAKKEMIISNARIISNGQTIVDHTGQAGILVLDNGDSKSKVTMRNVRVYSRNADISSVSTAKDVCASIVCSKQGAYDSYRSVSAVTAGQTRISATQGARPDYRKLPKE